MVTVKDLQRFVTQAGGTHIMTTLSHALCKPEQGTGKENATVEWKP